MVFKIKPKLGTIPIITKEKLLIVFHYYTGEKDLLFFQKNHSESLSLSEYYNFFTKTTYNMKYTLDKKGKYCVFKIQEDKLNTLIAPQLKSELVVLNAEGIKNIILDITDVKFADSSGLSAILIGNRLCTNINGSFVITSPQESVLKLIKISQLDNILNIVPTLAEAVDLVTLEEIERDVKEEDK